MDGLAKKLTAWFKSDVVLKVVSIVALVCGFLSIIISCFSYDYIYVDGDYVRKLVFNGNVLSILFSFRFAASNILFVLYAFIWRRKMKVGTFCMLYLICNMATNTLSLVSNILTISSTGLPLFIYQSLISCIGNITLVAMILFGLLPEKSFDNSVSSVPNVGSLNADKALELLNDKLDLGIITEEEYQVQRAEIISKL